jgi:hypothetical protein
MMASRGMGAVSTSKMPKGKRKARRDNTDFTQYAEGGKVNAAGYINVEPTILETNKKGETSTVANPNFEKFHKEWAEIAKVEKEIEHHDFTVEEFAGLETDANYPAFFSLLGLG